MKVPMFMRDGNQLRTVKLRKSVSDQRNGESRTRVRPGQARVLRGVRPTRPRCPIRDRTHVSIYGLSRGSTKEASRCGRTVDGDEQALRICFRGAEKS